MSFYTQKRIGILFNSSANWLGGVYYLVNLVNTFHKVELEKEKKPTFIIFYTDLSEPFIKLFEYDQIEFVKIIWKSEKRMFLHSLLSRRNAFMLKEFDRHKLDGLYPFNNFPVKTTSSTKLISWYPDLQHKVYPQHFSKFRLWQREFRAKKLLEHSPHLVVSSQAVLADFKRFYDFEKVKYSVLPFVSLTAKTNFVELHTLTEKYKIQSPFFLVSNQFYKHKDHICVLRAIQKLKEKGVKVNVVMTGKMEDYRDPNHVGNLFQYIKDNSLDNHLKLLGVIPRNEQLSLMKFALAVIQSSLFEGWSTVIEDAKSLKASIIASGIDIHKEQLSDQGLIYKPSDADALANCMLQCLKNPDLAKTNFNYDNHIRTFTQQFIQLFE